MFSVLLPVSAPFHCRLLAPAAEAVRAALAEIQIRAPAVPVVTNVTARPESAPEALRRHLVEQVVAGARPGHDIATPGCRAGGQKHHDAGEEAGAPCRRKAIHGSAHPLLTCARSAMWGSTWAAVPIGQR